LLLGRFVNLAFVASRRGTTAASPEKLAQRFSGRFCKENRVMNWDQLKGEWKEAKGKLRSKWAKLTDDDLENIAGKKDVLVGRLQQRYGWKKDQAEKDVDDYLKTV
jgi:uncharacterized protein YjbJ (UPF0337 family)